MWSLKQHFFCCKETDYKFREAPVKKFDFFLRHEERRNNKKQGLSPLSRRANGFFLFFWPFFPSVYSLFRSEYSTFFSWVWRQRKLGSQVFDVRALSFFRCCVFCTCVLKHFFFQISFMLDSRAKYPWAIESDEGLPCVSGATHPSMGFYFHVRGSLIYLIYLEGISSRV